MAEKVAQAPHQSLFDDSMDNRLQFWTNRHHRAREYMDIFFARWRQYWEWYRNVAEPLDDPLDWWRSNEPIPTPFKIIETLLPRKVLGMFDSPDWFSVEGRNFRSEVYETLVQNLLKQEIDGMQLIPKLIDALRYADVTGHAWGKVVWKEETELKRVTRPLPITQRQFISDELGPEAVAEAETITPNLDQVVGFGVEETFDKDVVFDGVDFDWISNDRLFPDPTGAGEWYIEEIETTLEKLMEIQEEMDLYDSKSFNNLVNELGPHRIMAQMGGDALGDARQGSTVPDRPRHSEFENIPEEYVSPTRDGTGVKLWQCWGWVPQHLRGKDEVPWRLMIVANKKYILRDVPAPTPDGKPPYFPIRSIQIPGRLYGESILNYVGPLAEQQSRLSNMRLDEVFLNIWQQYVYKSGSLVSDNSLLFQPGGAIAVNPGAGEGVDDVFKVLDRRDVLPSSFQEDSYRQAQAEHVAAAQDIFQGVSSGGRQTATEVERRLQQGNARHILQVMTADSTIKKEILTRTWKWLQSRLTSDRLVRLGGENAALVNMNDLQIPVDLTVGGGIFALSKETRVQRNQELVTLATNPITAQFFRLQPVLRQYMVDAGWTNPERFLKTETELGFDQYVQGFQNARASIAGQGLQSQIAAASGAPPGAAPPPGEAAQKRNGVSQVSSAGDAQKRTGGNIQSGGNQTTPV